MTVAVVAAMAEELASLSWRLAGKRPPQPGRWIECETGGREMLLATTGEGASQSSAALRALSSARSLDVVLGVGVGGGLSPELEAGDLVIAERVIDAATGAELTSEPTGWLTKGLRARSVQAGAVVSSPAIVWRAEAKRRLADLVVGAATAVVDLESAGWMAICAEAGLPVVIARCVCDPVDEDLPLDFEALRNPSGTVDRRRVVMAALVRPGVWIPLRRLERRVRAGSERIADWVLEVVAP